MQEADSMHSTPPLNSSSTIPRWSTLCGVRQMSCEIIQFSAAARPARPVSDKHASRGSNCDWQTALLRRGSGGAKESRSFPPQATQDPPGCGVRTRTSRGGVVARRAGGRLLARALAVAPSVGGRSMIGGSATARRSPPPVSAGPFEGVDMWREAVAYASAHSCRCRVEARQDQVGRI